MDQRTGRVRPQKVDLDPFQHRIQKPWGWEIVWAEEETYTGKLLHVLAGCRLSLQYHDEKLETQCLLSGRALLVTEDADGSPREIPMEAGKGYTIRPFQVHRLVALEDAEIVEVSTLETGTTVRLDDDYRRGDETESVRALPDRGWYGGSGPGKGPGGA
jgi:mannose-6-phosphate isomerase-like protein (cupin superfamily)